MMIFITCEINLYFYSLWLVFFYFFICYRMVLWGVEDARAPKLHINWHRSTPSPARLSGVSTTPAKKPLHVNKTSEIKTNIRNYIAFSRNYATWARSKYTPQVEDQIIRMYDKVIYKRCIKVGSTGACNNDVLQVSVGVGDFGLLTDLRVYYGSQIMW